MSEVLNDTYNLIDEMNGDKPAATRRQLVAGAAAAIGSMGLLGYAERAHAQGSDSENANSPQNIANIAATAEVLATIVNTVGPEKVRLDDVTRLNVRAAAAQEKIHYELLVSDAVGGKPLAKRVWVPDSVFSSAENLLKALVAGDQIFINAYLLANTVFARAGTLKGSQFARYTSEIMATEAVHRAVALQSLGRLGNDRAFMKFAQRESVKDIPSTGFPGFYRITTAAEQLQKLGFGFGEKGKEPGQFYDYDEVSKRTPGVGQGENEVFINTLQIS